MNDTRQRPRSLDFCLAALLITAGIAARLTFRDVPNFAPVAGLAMFAGYLLGPLWLAASVPLVTMAATDAVIGGYQWQLQLTIYALLTLPIAGRWWLRREIDGPDNSPLAASLLVVTGCLGASVIFFLGSNFMVWQLGSWYERSVAGLLTCYANALPFFRYTLAGDLVFGVGSFAVLGLCRFALRCHATWLGRSGSPQRAPRAAEAER